MTDKITPEEFNDYLDSVNAAEAKLRAEKEAEYIAFITPFEEQFEAATAKQRDKALKLLNPVKARIDKKIEGWKVALLRKIDKEMVKYNAVQKKAQEQFNASTVAEKAIYEGQIKDRKVQFEAEWQEIADANDRKIEEMRSRVQEDLVTLH